jgi:hypothetical protein
LSVAIFAISSRGGISALLLYIFFFTSVINLIFYLRLFLIRSSLNYKTFFGLF